MDEEDRIDVLVELLDRQLYAAGRAAIDVQALPRQAMLSRCPLATQTDPMTCDPMESTYSLARTIDRVNL